MDKKSFCRSCRRLFGLIAFIVTGVGLLVSTAVKDRSFYKTEIIIIIGSLFVISIVDHFKKVIEKDDKTRGQQNKFYVLICAFVGVTLTWFINHRMGYGPIIANGLVGVMAAIFLSNQLASITYTSSFVGMSSLSVIPSMTAAALGSLVVGIILLVTMEIYEGIGGKGGTTAALSTIITKTIIRFFV